MTSECKYIIVFIKRTSPKTTERREWIEGHYISRAHAEKRARHIASLPAVVKDSVRIIAYLRGSMTWNGMVRARFRRSDGGYTENMTLGDFLDQAVPS